MTFPLTQVENGADFISELGEVSRQLGLTRLRCSLFAIRIGRSDVVDALRRLKLNLERFGIIGVLENGQIGFLYLDRCCTSEQDDAALAHRIRNQVVEALKPDSLKGFVALHYWTDEVASVNDLVCRIEDRAFRRAEASAFHPVATAAV
jgi:hypothetical protein